MLGSSRKRYACSAVLSLGSLMLPLAACSSSSKGDADDTTPSDVTSDNPPTTPEAATPNTPTAHPVPNTTPTGPKPTGTPTLTPSKPNPDPDPTVISQPTVDPGPLTTDTNGGAPGTPEPSAGGSGGAGPSGGTGNDEMGGAASDAGMPAPIEPMLGQPIVYVGGYGGDYPLTIYDLDKASGALSVRGTSTEAGSSPSYLALHPNHKVLYAANEVDDASGGLTAMTIAADGSLTQLNHVTGTDGGFTYVGIDPTGQFAIGASYNGGSVSVFPIKEDGSLGEQADNKDFGANANSHCVAFDSTGHFAFVPNKGNNEVAQLLLGSDGKLTPNTPAQVSSESGAGPRHIAMRKDDAMAYVINELGSSITQYTVDNGLLTRGQTISTLPADFNGQSTGGHIELSPDGTLVYGSNRGHDSIVAFKADASGALTLVGHTPSGGKTPRDFDVDVTGEILIAANQDDSSLAVFALGTDGSVTPLGDAIAGPAQNSAVQILYLDP